MTNFLAYISCHNRSLKEFACNPMYDMYFSIETEMTICSTKDTKAKFREKYRYLLSL